MPQIESFAKEVRDLLDTGVTPEYFCLDGTIPYIILMDEEENPIACAHLEKQGARWTWTLSESSNIFAIIDRGHPIENNEDFNRIIGAYKISHGTAEFNGLGLS